MRYLRVVLVAAVVAAVVAFGPEAQAASTPITTCGQTVTTNAVLTTNLVCAGQEGIIVGAAGITIDLKGHVLRGDRTAFMAGIEDGTGFNHITIKNGVVRNFDFGVIAQAGVGPNDASRVSISQLTVSGNIGIGVFVQGDQASISTSTASWNSIGIDVIGDSATIKSSTASSNVQHGIAVLGDLASISSVTVSGNQQLGIRVQGDSASIKAATAPGNGQGIVVQGDAPSVSSSTASGNGRGIFLEGTSASVTSSSASGNDNEGVAVDGGPSASIKSVTASGNGLAGIDVTSASASIVSSTVSGNGTEGIHVDGDAAKVSGNRAETNGFAGGSDLAGLGILVENFTTAPVGTNVARANDDFTECDPLPLC
jgi:hypothetical protein